MSGGYVGKAQRPDGAHLVQTLTAGGAPVAMSPHSDLPITWYLALDVAEQRSTDDPDYQAAYMALCVSLLLDVGPPRRRLSFRRFGTGLFVCSP